MSKHKTTDTENGKNSTISEAKSVFSSWQCKNNQGWATLWKARGAGCGRWGGNRCAVA